MARPLSSSRPLRGRTLRLRLPVVAGFFVAALLIFGALSALVAIDPVPGVDDAVRDLADDARDESLLDFANEALDSLADPDLIIVLAVAAAIALVGLRWWMALVVLALGLGITGWAGSELKELFDRQRPAGNLDEATNEAFPSGHARYSFFWTWLAVTIAVKAPLDRFARWTIVAVGLALTALGGIARIYLQAHWLTDVVGGWSFSLLTFSGALLLAMLIAGALGRR